VRMPTKTPCGAVSGDNSKGGLKGKKTGSRGVYLEPSPFQKGGGGQASSVRGGKKLGGGLYHHTTKKKKKEKRKKYIGTSGRTTKRGESKNCAQMRNFQTLRIVPGSEH